jgi:hypothetical protein
MDFPLILLALRWLSLVVLAHMLMRQRSLKARGTAAVDEVIKKANPLASLADAVVSAFSPKLLAFIWSE